MIRSRLVSFVFAIGCAGLVSGCAELTPTQIPALAANRSTLPIASTQYRAFDYTGKPQSFRVPSGVTQVTILANGAAGGGASYYVAVGRGGRIHAVVPVKSSEVLYVYVGGSAITNYGGYNGGANAERWGECDGPFGGGGASDVREGGQKLADRIVVAGGGGGTGGDLCSYSGGSGGQGGSRTGGPGQDASGTGGGDGGGGGTQTSGGAGGERGSGAYGSKSDGKPGKLWLGGVGGKSGCSGNCPGGGGGGGGYYGGGGGGGGGYYYGSGGGGGGGSSFAEKTAKGFQMYRGWKDNVGDGDVTIEWLSK